METLRITAKTIEEAITKASIQLGVTSSELGYDVIEKGSAGFLGLGSKNSVIEAYRKCDKKVDQPIISPDIVETKVEIKNTKEVELPKKDHSEVKKNEKVESKKSQSKECMKDSKKDTKKEIKKEIKKEVSKETNKEVKSGVKVETKREPRVPVKIDDKTIGATRKFIEDVLKTMNIEANVLASVDEEGALAINIDGKNMGVLIGKRGQTLDSLQYLANRVANKEQDGYIRVKLDTENYRERRKKTLENLAKNIAYKVKRTRKPVSLEPMNPYERRIIHSALQDDNRISTHSEGEEPYRRVVVTLARK